VGGSQEATIISSAVLAQVSSGHPKSTSFTMAAANGRTCGTQRSMVVVLLAVSCLWNQLTGAVAQQNENASISSPLLQAGLRVSGGTPFVDVLAFFGAGNMTSNLPLQVRLSASKSACGEKHVGAVWAWPCCWLCEHTGPTFGTST
jgi:hypothetical protein